MERDRHGGFSLIEVLVSATIFTMVILGISQSVSLMYRFSRANLCKLQAHLLATSYMESVLYGTHPLSNSTSYALRQVSQPYSSTRDYLYLNNASQTFVKSVAIYPGSFIDVYLQLAAASTPLYSTNTIDRKTIFPPEGFQALLLVYGFDSPMKDSPAWNFSSSTVPGITVQDNIANRAHNALYALRLIHPDDP